MFTKFTKDDVARLVSELNADKLDPPVEIGSPSTFGLELELYDPVSGEIFTLARPHRGDIGQVEVLLTAAQVRHAVAAARVARLHAVRTAGFASIDAANEAHKRQAVARELASKQALERVALETKQAEEASKTATAKPSNRSTVPKSDAGLADDRRATGLEAEAARERTAAAQERSTQ